MSVPVPASAPTHPAFARLSRLVEQASHLAPDLAREVRELAVLVGGVGPWSGHPAQPTVGVPGPEGEMLSGHIEGRMLALLVRAAHARHVLEVGGFTGYSTLAIAEALPAGGRVVACGVDPDLAPFAQDRVDRCSSGARVDVRVGPVEDALAQLAVSEDRFDLVLVDAEHVRHVGTLLDTGLLGPDGLLCVDTGTARARTSSRTAADGTVPDLDADLDAVLAADPRVEPVVTPLPDGLTLARRVDGRS